MILLLRVVLVGLIIYLIVRAFAGYYRSGNETGPDRNSSQDSKKVSKKTGEYIDFEEVDK